uniref:Uncharacterized protein n=1 Tax=Esox lucius TaxID=8010 RepID=A0AAY5L475_ESOLU
FNLQKCHQLSYCLFRIRMNISNENRNVLSSVLPGKKPSNSQIVSSKIKSKILNTSSFFKVSLKTNNKALALALVAQKERSRQLEVETVQLRKQVESLCFDLAIRRHKDNQLILILKELQRNTLVSHKSEYTPQFCKYLIISFHVTTLKK